MGSYNEANSLSREELEVSRKVWGADHPSHASTLSNMGLLYINMNDLESASSALELALAIHESPGVRDEQGLAVVLNNLGYLHLGMGTVLNDTRAENYFKRAQELTRSSFGAVSLEYGINLDNLAA